MPLARLELARQAGLTQFGEPVVYTLAAGGAPFEVHGVWSDPHQVLELNGAETVVSTSEPKLGIDLPDFLARKVAAGYAATPPAERDSFVRAGVTWRVIDARPDSSGEGLDLIVHRV